MSRVENGAGGNDVEKQTRNGTGRSVRPVKRSIRIAGHATSVSLEDEFWHALRQIARQRGQSLSTLLTEVDKQRAGRSLASACRIYVLKFFQNQAAGQEMTGDGDGGTGE